MVAILLAYQTPILWTWSDPWSDVHIQMADCMTKLLPKMYIYCKYVTNRFIWPLTWSLPIFELPLAHHSLTLNIPLYLRTSLFSNQITLIMHRTFVFLKYIHIFGNNKTTFIYVIQNRKQHSELHSYLWNLLVSMWNPPFSPTNYIVWLVFSHFPPPPQPLPRK